MTADEIRRLLDLSPHPEEGGWFREVHRTEAVIPAEVLGPAFPGARSVSTAIYFLLTPETFSEMHRLPGDEVFHFYLGDPVEQLRLHEEGFSEIVRLGTDLGSGHRPLAVVPGGVWQGASLAPGGRYGFSLLGTTMAPGFDFADYERGSFEALVRRWPDRRDRLRRLTRS